MLKTGVVTILWKCNESMFILQERGLTKYQLWVNSFRGVYTNGETLEMVQQNDLFNYFY